MATSCGKRANSVQRSASSCWLLFMVCLYVELAQLTTDLEEAVRELRETSTRASADWRSLAAHTAAMQEMENEKFDLAKKINEQEAALSMLETEIEELRRESDDVEDWDVEQSVGTDKNAYVAAHTRCAHGTYNYAALLFSFSEAWALCRTTALVRLTSRSRCSWCGHLSEMQPPRSMWTQHPCKSRSYHLRSSPHSSGRPQSSPSRTV